MNTHWFKPKEFGLGATPTTWEGWAVIAAYVVVVLGATLYQIIHDKSRVPSALWFAVVIGATLIVTAVSWAKTDGSWQWRWGQTQDSQTRN
jgi:hypothetical protein